jgi:hypothetical protein
MTPQPSPTSRVRLGLLLGLVFTLGVVLFGLRFLGRRAEIAATVAKLTQVPSARRQVSALPRSSASLKLDESKNVWPDAPEVTPASLRRLDDQVYEKVLAIATEMQLADSTRLLGFSVRAEVVLDAMMKEPRFIEMRAIMEQQEERWPSADTAERAQVMVARRVGYDELLAETRVRLAAIR